MAPDGSVIQMNRPGRPTRGESEHRQSLVHIGDNTYDLDRFYVTSTNEHDHDEQLRIRMPRWLVMELQQMVREERLPAYRSTHDVIRDALVHRVRYIRDTFLTDDDVAWVKLEILRGNAGVLQGKRQARKEMYQIARDTLAEAHAAKNEEDIESSRALVREIADDIGEPWASELRVLLATTYTDVRNGSNVPAEELWRS